MKRLFFLVLALLLFVGIANATNIPGAVDAVNNREVWVTSVYNNETAEMSVGDCVEWDMDSSTGDDKGYVVECDSTDTYLVAGVVFPAAIASKSTGLIAVKGPVNVNTVTDTMVTGTLVCSSATEGKVYNCSVGAGDANALGYTTAASTGSSAIVNIFAR